MKHDKNKVLISTVPFGENNKLPLSLLDRPDINYVLNPFKRKLSEDDLCELIEDVHILIAGTENNKRVFENAKKLKIIARVGIGLDNVDLLTAKMKSIKVCYTPDAPTLAVSELTVGLILNLLRSIHLSNEELHNGYWRRYFGQRISMLLSE